MSSDLNVGDRIRSTIGGEEYRVVAIDDAPEEPYSILAVRDGADYAERFYAGQFTRLARPVLEDGEIKMEDMTKRDTTTLWHQYRMAALTGFLARGENIRMAYIMATNAADQSGVEKYA